MLQVRLFGRFEARTAAAPVPLPARRDALRLWQYLLVHRSVPTSRDVVASALWPDAPADKARGYLRINLHALMALLSDIDPAATWLIRDAKSLRWNEWAPAWVDLDEFEAIGRQVAVTGGRDEDDHGDLLARMVELYQGDLLDDASDDWMIAARSHARAEVIRALDRLAEHQRAEGDVESSATSLDRLLTFDPLNESAACRRMELLAAAGNQSAAMAVFQRLSAALRSTLDIDPSAETSAVVARIATDAQRTVLSPQAEPPVTRRLPTPISRFVGRQHELQTILGLVRTERLVTVLGTGGAGKTRLAIEVARGAGNEFADGVCFLDLTRLTVGDDPWTEVARSLGISLSGGRSPAEQVCTHLASLDMLIVLDNCEHVLDGIAQLTAQLLVTAPSVHILATSRSPLGVDGEFRWPIPPLGLPGARNVGNGPTEGPAEAVELFIERVRSIRSRFTPSVDEIPAIEAICHRLDGLPLAIELAAARANVLSIRDLSQRLESGFRLLRLDTASLPERHRTIDACIDWSVQLTGASEQRLLARLSVFPSTFTLEATEVVCADDDSATGSVLDGLGRLVDVGLVSVIDDPVSSRRFRMLQPIRAYADANMAADVRLLSQARHATYFLERAERVEHHLLEQRDEAVDHDLDLEVPDFRVALDTLGAAGNTERALRLCGAIWRLWYDRGNCAYERRQLDNLLAGSTGTVSIRTAGRGWLAAGALAYRQGDQASAEHHFASAVDALSQGSDIHSLARALEYLGIVRIVRGEPVQAQQSFQRLVEVLGDHAEPSRLVGARHRLAQIQASQGDLPAAHATLNECMASTEVLPFELTLDIRESLARVRYLLGDFAAANEQVEQGVLDARGIHRKRKVLLWQILHGLIASALGEYEAANAILREVAAAWRADGDLREIARAYHNLAEVALAQGDHPTARTYLTESRRRKVEAYDQWGLVFTDIGLATLAHETGAFAEALATATVATADARERQDKCLIAWALQTAARAAIALDRLDEAAAALGECAALLAITCEQRRIAMALERAAMLARARGQHAAAARLLGAADGIRTAIGSPPTHGEAADREGCVAAVREAIGDTAFDGEADAGRRLSQPDALAMVAQLCDDLALSA